MCGLPNAHGFAVEDSYTKADVFSYTGDAILYSRENVVIGILK